MSGDRGDVGRGETGLSGGSDGSRPPMVRYYELSTREDPPGTMEASSSESPPLAGRLRRLLAAFSLKRNAAKILDTRKLPGDIGCMYGIRALSVVWITLLHSDNMASVEHPFMMTLAELRWWPLTILGPTLVPDSFLLLSATLVSYNHFRGVARSGPDAPRGGGFWLKRLVKRYWRLTPPHMAVVWVLAVGLSWHYGNSPFWPTDRRAGLEPGCDPYWWRNLLLVHNLFPHSEMCIDQTWYLAVEWQLFLVTPPLLILLERSVVAGTLLLTALMASAAGMNLALAVWYDFVGEMMAVLQAGIPANNQAFRDVTYDKPYIRSVGYLLGLLLGRLLSYLQHEAAPDSRLRRMSDKLAARRGLAAVAMAIALFLMVLGMGPASHRRRNVASSRVRPYRCGPHLVVSRGCLDRVRWSAGLRRRCGLVPQLGVLQAAGSPHVLHVLAASCATGHVLVELGDTELPKSQSDGGGRHRSQRRQLHRRLLLVPALRDAAPRAHEDAGRRQVVDDDGAGDSKWKVKWNKDVI